MGAFNTLEMTEKLIENPELRAMSYSSGATVANIGGTISYICPYSRAYLGPLETDGRYGQTKWRIIEKDEPLCHPSFSVGFGR